MNPLIRHPLIRNESMKFFIDTGNLAQIKEANDLGILDGVTTNPSLMAKEGVKGEEAIAQHYKSICELVDGDISAEVLSTDFAGMVEEGKKTRGYSPQYRGKSADDQRWYQSHQMVYR
eukprot:Opistho-1_new@106138